MASDQPLKRKTVSKNIRKIAIENKKCIINLNKATYIGSNKLDLNKVLLKDFRNNCIKKKIWW